MSLPARVLALAVLLVAGTVVAAVSDSTAWKAVGFALGGLASILLVGLLFYEIGLSEDRERERRQQR